MESVTLTKDDWLSGVLGVASYHLNLARPIGAFNPELLLKKIDTPQFFVDIKLGLDEGALITPLVKCGFELVDTLVTLQWQSCQLKESSLITVSDFYAPWETHILNIAESSFKFSRFHQDKKIPLKTANLIKREWTKNYLNKKRGDDFLVAIIKDKPVGFLAVIKNQDIARIDLIAVSSPYQKQGVALALVTAFIKKYSSQFKLEVGTQLSNIPSLTLYHRTGFLIQKAQYVLHTHQGDLPP